MKIEGAYRIACVVPKLHLANPLANAEEIISIGRKLDRQEVGIAVFPELTLTGYTCGDLFFQDALYNGVEAALAKIVDASQKWRVALLLGFPWRVRGANYDCAALIQNGEIKGITAKHYLDSGQERHFQPFSADMENDTIFCRILKEEHSLFRSFWQTKDGMRFCVEFGNELYGVNTTADRFVPYGVSAVFNLSAMPQHVDTIEKRRRAVAERSSRLKCLYAIANAGSGESSSANVFAGGAEIAFDGEILASSPVFAENASVCTADFLPRWSDALRRRQPWCRLDVDCSYGYELYDDVRHVEKDVNLKISDKPFALGDGELAEARAKVVLDTLATGLRRRAELTHSQHLVIGISGGIDSTFALLVCDRCRELMKQKNDFVIAITMPGMGTSSRTKNNAVELATKLKCDLRTISIKKAVLQHFEDIGHEAKNTNVVYENAQARERTQILMDLANEVGGLVVGTGDLSEIALGWCTYNGDHIAMYNVNGDVPKTYMRELVRALAKTKYAVVAKPLIDVVETPVSPELLPGAQHTEEIIGNYELHEFFLYYMLKYNEMPNVIYELAKAAFKGTHTEDEIKKALQLFVRRFFTQQFKRNAATDGPAIGSISLSPGNWQMPSDADFGGCWSR